MRQRTTLNLRLTPLIYEACESLKEFSDVRSDTLTPIAKTCALIGYWGLREAKIIFDLRDDVRNTQAPTNNISQVTQVMETEHNRLEDTLIRLHAIIPIPNETITNFNSVVTLRKSHHLQQQTLLLDALRDD